MYMGVGFVYMNVGYLTDEHNMIVDDKRALLVTGAGNYRIAEDERGINTKRPSGRGDYQLLYVADGVLYVRFDGVDRRVPKGNMILFRPGQTQIYYTLQKLKCETYWVHFTGYDVERLLDRYMLPNEKMAIFTGISPDYAWLFRQMIQELQLKHKNFEDLLSINLQHIFLMINRYQSEALELDAQLLNEIERATHYFNENYALDISIEEYARSRHLGVCWFIRSFKKVVKLTPMQYIVSLRIASAKRLLVDTDYNISQISEAVGYDNALYFSRLFKKHAGTSPSEYRKRINEEE